MTSSKPLLTRHDLEQKAAAIIELKRRKLERMNGEPVVYGIYTDGPNLLRCWQKQGDEFVRVDKDPVVTLPLKMEPALLRPKPITLLVGGRGSGKSESVAALFAGRMKDEGCKVACFREFQNSISDSVHSIIQKHVEQKQFSGFSLLESKIDHENGAQCRYRGLARNPEGVKSMDGFKYAWIEEAQTISSRSIELVEPTFREDGAEVWYSLNPGSSADPISIEHLMPYEKQLRANGIYEDETTLIIVMNYRDNPWFPDILDMKRKKNKSMWSQAKYAHVWEGEYNDEVENSIIKVEWFQAAIDAHKKLGFKPVGVKVAAHDPSDEGDDAKGYALRHGSVILDVQEKTGCDVNDGCDWATDLAIRAQADYFSMDCDGLGASLRRQASDSFKGKRISLEVFKGSEGVENPDASYMDLEDDSRRLTNKQALKNRRAQYYKRLADRFYKTYRAVEHSDYIDPDELISLSSEINCLNALQAEICRIPRKVNGSGLFQIMTKQEMAKEPYRLPSPNMADSVMMTMINPDPIDSDYEEITFVGG